MLQNLKARLKSQKGFSLVELIVVIAIMVILIAMLLPSVVGLIGQATEAQNVSAASTIFTTANTALTSNAAKNASDRKASFAKTTVGVKCLKGSVNGTMYWPGVKVYTDKEARAAICVTYQPDGSDVIYVNPPEYCTNGDGKASADTDVTGKLPSGFKTCSFNADGSGTWS